MPHERKLHEQVGILALAFRAGLASRNGLSFAIRPASGWIDRHQGTDLFVVKSDPEGSRALRVDLTEGHRVTLRNKIRRAVRKSQNGGRWVKIIYLPREVVISIAVNSCFLRTYERYLADRDMQLVSFDEACPIHGNNCSFASELFRLGRSLNSQLKRGFQMPVSTSPLPSR